MSCVLAPDHAAPKDTTQVSESLYGDNGKERERQRRRLNKDILLRLQVRHMICHTTSHVYTIRHAKCYEEAREKATDKDDLSL